MEVEEYKTISKFTETELKIKGSRFLGKLYPVSSTDDTDLILVQCKKEFYDATHRCFAYRLGADGSISRSSDDGEPSGTAGKPILSILEHNGISYCLLIVIRYFGGTKLGTGGLVRAYTEAAQSVIENASIITVPVLSAIRITFPYDYTSGVMHVISQYDLKIQDTDYGEDVTIHVGIRPSVIDSFGNDLRDITSGNIAIKR